MSDTTKQIHVTSQFMRNEARPITKCKKHPVWIKRFILFDLKCPPKDLGEQEEIHF